MRDVRRLFAGVVLITNGTVITITLPFLPTFQLLADLSEFTCLSFLNYNKYFLSLENRSITITNRSWWESKVNTLSHAYSFNNNLLQPIAVAKSIRLKATASNLPPA
jgi:hypothetical protein